jgi:gas vesicle protein
MIACLWETLLGMLVGGVIGIAAMACLLLATE